jgi:hypothetical protein
LFKKTCVVALFLESCIIAQSISIKFKKKTPYSEKLAVWRQPEVLWQSNPEVLSGAMFCLRVLARS